MPDSTRIPETPRQTQAQESLAWDLFWIFVVGLLFRALLLWFYPVPYGNDGLGRIFFKDRIFLAHWLPLTQWIVYVWSQLHESIFGIRFCFAILGALSAGAFYLFLRSVTNRFWAIAGGLFFSLNSLYVILSLMPYQDVLFLGLLFSSLYFLTRSVPPLESRFASLLFGLACLTRYESWFLIPALITWKVRVGGKKDLPKVGELIRGLLSFGWAPLLWFLLSHLYYGRWNSFLYQTQDQEFYAWHPHLDLGWMLHYATRMLFWLGRFGSPYIAFAVPGLIALIVMYRGGRRLVPSIRLLLLMGVLVIVFFFCIIGKEQETVFRFVMIPLSIGLVLAVLGMEATDRWVATRGARFARWAPGLRMLLLVSLILTLLSQSTLSVARLNAENEYLDPYRIARYLDSRLDPDQALVVAPREPDLHDDSPGAYQRIVAQSVHGPELIVSAGNLSETRAKELLRYAKARNVRYLVLFEDFLPWLAADVFFAGLAQSRSGWARPVLTTETATVFEVAGWPEGLLENGSIKR